MLRCSSRVPHNLEALKRAIVAPEVYVPLAGSNAQLLRYRVHAVEVWQEKSAPAVCCAYDDAVALGVKLVCGLHGLWRAQHVYVVHKLI
jgi:hypothetical protein